MLYQFSQATSDGVMTLTVTSIAVSAVLRLIVAVRMRCATIVQAGYRQRLTSFPTAFTWRHD